MLFYLCHAHGEKNGELHVPSLDNEQVLRVMIAIVYLSLTLRLVLPRIKQLCNRV